MEAGPLYQAVPLVVSGLTSAWASFGLSRSLRQKAPAAGLILIGLTFAFPVIAKLIVWFRER
jgi:hypothetical protein